MVEMDLDEATDTTMSVTKSKKLKKPGRIHKRSHRKASANMTFPTYRKGRIVATGKKGKR